jgi:hypothetical protein
MIQTNPTPSPSQKAAWDALWRLLLTPKAGEQPKQADPPVPDRRAGS